MVLSSSDLENLTAARDIGKGQLERLESGNNVRESHRGDGDGFIRDDFLKAVKKKDRFTRYEFISLIKMSLRELHQAESLNDPAAVADVVQEIEHYDTLLDKFQEVALIEFEDLHATILNQLYLIVEKKVTSSTLLANQALRMVINFKQAQFPAELLDLYAHYALESIEMFLNHESRRISKIAAEGVLNTDDIPALIRLLVPLRGAARKAVRAYYAVLTNRARLKAISDAQDPGVFEIIWSVAGYNSFKDFAIDAGLFVITGGTSAVVRYGRILVKAVQVKKRIGRVKKLKKLIEFYEDDLEKIRNAQVKIRKRLQLRGAKTSRHSRGLAKYGSEIFEKIQDLTKDYIQSKEATVVLMETLEKAGKYTATIAAQDFTDVILLNSNQQSGGSSTVQKIIPNILSERIKELLKASDIFGSSIDIAKEKLVRQLVIGKAHKRAFSVWFSLLITRQYVVRFILHTARKQSLTPKDVRELFINSVFAAIEEGLIEELELPKTAVSSFIKSLSSLLRQSATKIVNAAVTELVNMHMRE